MKAKEERANTDRWYLLFLYIFFFRCRGAVCTHFAIAVCAQTTSIYLVCILYTSPQKQHKKNADICVKMPCHLPKKNMYEMALLSLFFFLWIEVNVRLQLEVALLFVYKRFFSRLGNDERRKIRRIRYRKKGGLKGRGDHNNSKVVVNISNIHVKCYMGESKKKCQSENVFAQQKLCFRDERRCAKWKDTVRNELSAIFVGQGNITKCPNTRGNWKIIFRK